MITNYEIRGICKKCGSIVLSPLKSINPGQLEQHCLECETNIKEDSIIKRAELTDRDYLKVCAIESITSKMYDKRDILRVTLGKVLEGYIKAYKKDELTLILGVLISENRKLSINTINTLIDSYKSILNANKNSIQNLLPKNSKTSEFIKKNKELEIEKANRLKKNFNRLFQEVIKEYDYNKINLAVACNRYPLFCALNKALFLNNPENFVDNFQLNLAFGPMTKNKSKQVKALINAFQIAGYSVETTTMEQLNAKVITVTIDKQNHQNKKQFKEYGLLSAEYLLKELENVI